MLQYGKFPAHAAHHAKYHICFIQRKHRPEEELSDSSIVCVYFVSRVSGDSCIDAVYPPLSLHPVSLFLSLLSSGICMKISITTERSCIANESLIPRG